MRIRISGAVKAAGAAFALAVFVSCATAPVTHELNPDTDYQQDPEIVVGKIRGKGIVVTPRAASYPVEISTPGNADVVHVQTCHRFFTSNEYPSGWFTDKKRYQFTYVPAGDVEEGCIVHIELYEANANQRHSAADIIPASPAHALPASLQCNGEVSNPGSSLNQGGTTACQSKAGFIQKIIFTEPVDVAAARADERPESCEFPPATDGRTFIFPIASGRCVVEFQEQKAPFRRHILRTYGFTEAPWRNKK